MTHGRPNSCAPREGGPCLEPLGRIGEFFHEPEVKAGPVAEGKEIRECNKQNGEEKQQRSLSQYCYPIVLGL